MNTLNNPMKKNSDKKLNTNKIGRIVAAVVLAVVTLFVALIIGLPLYLYLPFGAIVFCFAALIFYLFSFRRTKPISDDYQEPPPPQF